MRDHREAVFQSYAKVRKGLGASLFLASDPEPSPTPLPRGLSLPTSFGRVYPPCEGLATRRKKQAVPSPQRGRGCPKGRRGGARAASVLFSCAGGNSPKPNPLPGAPRLPSPVKGRGIKQKRGLAAALPCFHSREYGNQFTGMLFVATLSAGVRSGTDEPTSAFTVSAAGALRGVRG